MVIQMEVPDGGTPPQIITLITDFGSKDAYVGCMKGVILSIHPQVKVVDISHDIPKFNVRYGAFVLAQVFRYFPEGTIHVAVVDPGVGTARRPLVIKTSNYFFIGPDNGVLAFAASEDGVRRVVEITNKEYMLRGPSKTFAGRDVFAPAAAHIAKGVSLDEIGPDVDDFRALPIPRPTVAGDRVIGEVLVVDSFGNLITNIRPSDFERRVKPGLLLKTEVRKTVKELPFVNTYREVKRGEVMALIGSSGFLEIAVNQGSASQVFEAEQGDPIKITFLP